MNKEFTYAQEVIKGIKNHKAFQEEVIKSIIDRGEVHITLDTDCTLDTIVFDYYDCIEFEKDECCYIPDNGSKRTLFYYDNYDYFIKGEKGE